MDPACVVLPTEKESSGKIEGSETDKEGEGRKEARGQGGREEQLLMGCIDLEIAAAVSRASSSGRRRSLAVRTRAICAWTEHGAVPS